ncbi:MAG: DUF3108 domain-containing protein [Alphaproteobacteria bacterium]|nr:DUF3108 domain-containing protein [Alphaproteobacteria bacterium]
MKSLFIWTSIFLLGIGSLAGGASAKSGSEKTSVLTYDVYAGGIHAMNARLTLYKKQGQYGVSLTAGTQGILKKLANWSGRFQSEGQISAGKTFPFTHQSDSVWKESTQSKYFKYDGKGHFKSYKMTEDGDDKTPKDVDISLAKGTTDILSSTFELMISMPKSKVCKGNQLIFDGDRNFRLVFKDTKTEDLQKTDFNTFSGPALSCSVEVVPEKGKWRKKPRGWLSIQEQGRQKGALPTVWFGALKGQPDVYVPVKIRIKTDYGTLFMHLTSEKTS